MLYAFFWVVPRHLEFECRHFGTHGVFPNVGVWTPDAGELPKRKHTTYGTWRKLEIKE